MGVKGLLPCLQSITRTVSLDRYRGLTVAVDAMSWLHKGVFCCDVKTLAKSQRSDDGSGNLVAVELKCIKYTINKAEILQNQFGMEVILVIDGDSLPSKKEENAQRREERDKAFGKAVAAEKARDSRAARRFYAQSCSVTHKIRYELIKACKQLGISFIVAPYEADAQMARLAHTGAVDLVLTEDSDILVYGCPRALFKVDFDTSRGQEIQLMRDLGENVTPSFRNWTHDMFVFMCIISGCDYCKGVPGIGIKLAHKLVRVHRTPSKIFSSLRAAGRMPTDFEEKFWIAFRTFRHQRVFCPSKQQIETLWPIVGSNHEASPDQVWPFLGESIEPRIASKIADGTFHPSKKLEWSVALKSEATTNIIQHRPSSTNDGGGNTRRGANSEKTNVWHSLVYGPKDDGRRSRQLLSTAGKENESQLPAQNHSKKDMFSFFPQKKTHHRGSRDGKLNSNQPEALDTIRPPLQEIYVGDTESASQPKSNSKPPAHPNDVRTGSAVSTKYSAQHHHQPIHFHEYASRLVGRSFKPISRKRKKQDNNPGSKASKYVQKIWEKVAERSEKEEHHVEPQKVDNHDELAKGVSLFKRDNNQPNPSSLPKLHHDIKCSGAAGVDELYRGSPSLFRHNVDPRLTTHQQYDYADDLTRAGYQYDSTHEGRLVHDGDHSSQTAFYDVAQSSYPHESNVLQKASIDRSEQDFGYQSWYLEDADTTTCEGSSHAQHHISSYDPHFSRQPQYGNGSVCIDSSQIESKDSGVEESNVFDELRSPVVGYGHSESNLFLNCDTSLGVYQHYKDDDNGVNPFQQLRTTMKPKRSYSPQRDYDVNYVRTATEVNPVRAEFQQLKTTRKVRHDDGDSSQQGYVHHQQNESHCHDYYSDHGRDVNQPALEVNPAYATGDTCDGRDGIWGSDACSLFDPFQHL